MGGQPLLSVVQWLVVLDLVLVGNRYARKTTQGSWFLYSPVPRGLERGDGSGQVRESILDGVDNVRMLLVPKRDEFGLWAR